MADPLAFAIWKHRGQEYRDGQPYVHHCQRVAAPFYENDVLYAAAILHDVLEDTDATLRDVQKRFGVNVSEIVLVLTRNEQETYAEYIERVKLHSDARKIKLMDLGDNLAHCLRPDELECRRGLIDRYTKAIRELAL